MQHGLVEAEPVAIPDRIAGWLRRVAGERYGIDWSALDYIDSLAADGRPLLLLHGTDDDVVPIATSRELAALRDEGDDLVYIEVPGAPHTLAWNVAPIAYERCVAAFLQAASAGAPSRAAAACAELAEG